MLDVQCACGTRLSLPDDWAGRKGKCPTCGAVLNIAASPPAAPSIAAAPFVVAPQVVAPQATQPPAPQRSSQSTPPVQPVVPPAISAAVPPQAIAGSASPGNVPAMPMPKLRSQTLDRPPAGIKRPPAARPAPVAPATAPPVVDDRAKQAIPPVVDDRAKQQLGTDYPLAAAELPNRSAPEIQPSISRLLGLQPPPAFDIRPREPAHTSPPSSLAERLRPGGWSRNMWFASGGGAAAVLLIVIAIAALSGDAPQPVASTGNPDSAKGAAQNNGAANETPRVPSVNHSSAENPTANHSSASSTQPRQSNPPTTVQEEEEPPRSSIGGNSGNGNSNPPASSRVIDNQRNPGRSTRPPEGLAGASREYDDLHCRRLQSQHAVRIPPSATILEVNGERLPIVNVDELAASPAPYLFLPRGTHAVKFRPNESPVSIAIAGDFASVHSQMRHFFDADGTLHERELASRSAKAMDVHSAPLLLNLMGFGHAAREEWDAAERKFRRSLRVNPMFSPAHLNLAYCLLRRKARAEAAREVELADVYNVGNVFGLSAAIAGLRRQLNLPAGVPVESELTVRSYVHNETLSEEDKRLTALMLGMSKYAVKETERGKILNNLAVHFAETGRTELALDHFRGALAVIKQAGPERFALARQVLTHMADACRKAGFAEAEEYQKMRDLVTP